MCFLKFTIFSRLAKNNTFFSVLFLLSDYRFLEDVGRTADAAARDLSVHRPTTNKFVSFKLATWSVGDRVDYLYIPAEAVPVQISELITSTVKVWMTRDIRARNQGRSPGLCNSSIGGYIQLLRRINC